MKGTDHKIQTRGGVLHALMSFGKAFDLKGQKKREREQNSVKCYVTKKETEVEMLVLQS